MKKISLQATAVHRCARGAMLHSMAIPVVEFTCEGYKIRKFLAEIIIPKGNYGILRISVMVSCQKLGIILET